MTAHVEETPRRIQLRRTKGYRKPEGAVVVARPSKWGNPFPLDGGWIVWTAVALGYTANPAGRREAALALHRSWLLQEPIQLGPFAGAGKGGVIEFSDGTERTLNEHAMGLASVAAAFEQPPTVPARPLGDIAELAGRDLACWCPLDQPCHADVLLEVANRSPERVGGSDASRRGGDA